MDPSPTDVIHPVREQLAAYNARDIDAFMPWWAEDCRLYAFPDQLLAAGTEAIRARHIERFREPQLHGRLVGRSVVGTLVVDREVVTRNFPDGPHQGVGEVDVLALYDVRHGRIARAWFSMGPPRPCTDGPFTLRTAGPADAAEVRDLTRAAYAKWVPVIGREPRPMLADYDAAVRDHRIDLLCGDGGLAALAEMVPASDHLLIRNLAVAPAWQGRGLGRRLLDHAEQVAVAMGVPRVTLYTNAKFTENLRLYLGHGYGIDHADQSELGTTIYMSKAVGRGR